MSIKNAIASVAVKDLEAAAPWYQALFGRDADSRPMAGVAEWKFSRGGWLQVYERSERAGQGSVTLAVSDLEALAAHLDDLGLADGKRTANDQVKTLTIADPDGNLLAFAEALDPTMAH